MPLCECENDYHVNGHCNRYADTGTVATSPVLCTSCLYSCVP